MSNNGTPVPQYRVGQRLRTVAPITTQAGIAVPVGTLVEVMVARVLSRAVLYSVRAVWREATGGICEDVCINCSAERFATVRGAPRFPGEPFPQKGQSYGKVGRKDGKVTVPGADPVPAPVKRVKSTKGYRQSAGTAPVAHSPRTGRSSMKLQYRDALTPAETALVGTLCPTCKGHPLVAKHGKYGPFVGCDGFKANGCRYVLREWEATQAAQAAQAEQAAAPASPLGTLLDAALAARAAQAAVNGIIQQVAPQVTQPVVEAPAPQPTPQPAPKPTRAPRASTYTFPLAKARQLAVKARQAIAQDRLPTAFSPRALFTWAAASTSLHDAALVPNGDHATAAGYALAVLDRETGDTRKMLKELFVGMFATDPDKASEALSLEALIQHAYEVGLPLWVHGGTGVGKTTTMENTLRALGANPVMAQGSSEKTIDDVLGSVALAVENGATKTVTHYGFLAVAMKAGRPLVLDEISAYRPEVLLLFQQVLQGQPLVLERGSEGVETILPQPGFWIGATDNTTGAGEGDLFTGTNAVNLATRNRFAFRRQDEMSETQELALAQAAIDRVRATGRLLWA